MLVMSLMWVCGFPLDSPETIKAVKTSTFVLLRSDLTANPTFWLASCKRHRLPKEDAAFFVK